MERVHASCVAIAGDGVLIRGPSGAGKSDLALRLIDQGAQLVADDYTELRLVARQVLASPPERLRGLLEVRGLGIVRLQPTPDPVPLALVVDLAAAAAIERLPSPALTELLGQDIPVMRLAPFDPSAGARLRLGLRLAKGDITRIALED